MIIIYFVLHGHYVAIMCELTL